MTSTKRDLLHGLPANRRSTELRRALSQAGVRRDESGRGRMKDDVFAADVVVEPDDFVTVRANSDGMTEPLAALERGGRLQGNARFGIGNCGWQLAADTRVNGVVHLPESLKEIRNAFRRGITGSASCDDRCDVDDDPADAVNRVIEESGWSEEQIVKVEQGWELQPRLAGATVPVAMRIDDNDVKVYCSVLASLPKDADTVGAVTHQALLFNSRLRFARLSVVAERLIVETRLRTDLISTSWLEFSARAVASAAQGVTPTLTLVAHDPAVARHYATLILNH